MNTDFRFGLAGAPIRYNESMKAILNELQLALSQALGDKLHQVILFGSYSRGEARPDSDLDVLIVVKGEFDYASLIRQTSELAAKISLEHDIVISRAFVSRDQFRNEQLPFLINIRREGIPI